MYNHDNQVVSRIIYIIYKYIICNIYSNYLIDWLNHILARGGNGGWNRVSCSPGWPWTHYLNSWSSCFPSPESWDYRYVPSQPVYAALVIKSMALCMLGRHFYKLSHIPVIESLTQWALCILCILYLVNLTNFETITIQELNHIQSKH